MIFQLRICSRFDIASTTVINEFEDSKFSSAALQITENALNTCGHKEKQTFLLPGTNFDNLR